jgi:hypothetical protein
MSVKPPGVLRRRIGVSNHILQSPNAAASIDRGCKALESMVSTDKTQVTTLSHSFVGIFWAVEGKRKAAVVLDHRCPISEAEPYGDMLTCPHGHYEVWEEWRKNSRGDRLGVASLIWMDEYEDWPRGRIVYSSSHHHFVLYADVQILSRPDLMTVIQERFGLATDGTQRKRDSHYVSTRRLAAGEVRRR